MHVQVHANPSAGSTGLGESGVEVPHQPKSGWRRKSIAAVAIIFASVLFSAVCVLAITERPTVRVIPGEFEQHDLLLVAWPTVHPHDDIYATHSQIISDIMTAVEDQIEVAVITKDEASREEASRVLFAANTVRPRHRFLQAPTETIWVRDYGPIVAKSFYGGYEMIDTVYRHKKYKELDDVPSAINGSLGLPLIDTPIVMENGNLASNGAGLCVASQKLVIENGESEAQATKLLRKYLGAEQVVYMENMIGEPTGHVDIFLTFTAPDTVVVGQYARSYDPENADILDRNAHRLEGLNTACGPLKVHRIPMLKRPDGRWRTFTNVVFANGVLLVPAYGERYREEEKQALALYRSLLPTWKVIDIDCSKLIQSDGALHCATMNVYRARRQDFSE